MLNIKDKIKSLFNRKPQFEEIFSTSEKKNNIGNTNPLNLGEEDAGIMLSGYKPINFEVKSNNFKYSDESNYDVAIKRTTKDIVKSRLILLFLIILFLLSLGIDIAYRFYPFIFNFSSINKNYLYLYFGGTINIIFLIYTIVFFIRELKLSKTLLLGNGTMALLTGVFSLLQCLSMYVNLKSENINIYVSIFCLYVIMMHLNSFFVKQRIKRNVKFVSSKKTKYVSGMYEKNDMDSNGKHKVAYRKIQPSINDFFNASFMVTSLSRISFLLNAFILLIAVIIMCLCIAGSYSLTYIFSALTITFLMLSPVQFIAIINFHINGICKKALRKGAMITSLYAAQCFFKTDAVVIDASNLYNADNVVLRSIKTFKGQRIDEAILRAAAVICSIGGPLSTVFDKIIMGKKNMLSKLIEVKYEDEMGVVGYIDSQRVLLGNRELLKKYKVDPPSRDYEKKYIDKGMEHIYLAMDRDLVAMFVLEYLPSKNLKKCLSNLDKNGITLFVKTADCNITAEKISKDFNISNDGVKILKFRTSEQISKIENIKNENPPALLCTFERVSSFIWGLCLSKKMFIRKNITMMIMALASILGCVFSVSLAATGGIDAIKPIELGVYYLFWTFMSVLIPKFIL